MVRIQNFEGEGRNKELFGSSRNREDLKVQKASFLKCQFKKLLCAPLIMR